MSKTTKNIFVEDFYKTPLTNNLADSGDITLNVGTPPAHPKGFIIVNPESNSNRERMYYSSVSGNSITVRGVDRKEPKEHFAGEQVQINDTSLIFNYLSGLASTTFFAEKTSALSVLIWGGPILKDGDTVAVSDTTIALTDGSTNYIYYKASSNEIKVTTTESAAQTDNGIIVTEIVTASGIITSISYRNHKLGVGRFVKTIAKTGTSGIIDTYTVTYTDGTTYNYNVTNGSGIDDIVKTGTNGIVDTYTINFDNGNTTNFFVTNGNGIDRIEQTAGNNEAGTIDTYTIFFDNGDTGTFTVQNGFSGQGILDSVTSGVNINVDNSNAANPIINLDIQEEVDLHNNNIANGNEIHAVTFHGSGLHLTDLPPTAHVDNIPVGGKPGESLLKTSNTDYDVDWGTPKKITSFDNIFNHGDVIENVFDLKNGKCESILYKDTIIEKGNTDIFVADTGFNYPDNSFLISKVTGDTWVNGTDNTNSTYYIYEKSRKLGLGADSSGTVTLNKSFSLPFFDGYFGLYIYVSNQSNIDEASIRFQTDAANYFEIDILSQITQNGFNFIKIPHSSLTSVGTPDSTNLTGVRFAFSTSAAGVCDFYIDLISSKKNNVTDNHFTLSDKYDYLESKFIGVSYGNQVESIDLNTGDQNNEYLDFIFEGNFTTKSESTNVFDIHFRKTGNTFYYVSFDDNANTVTLGKSISGVKSIISTVSATITTGVSNSYKIDILKDVINVSLGASLLLTATDTDISVKGGIGAEFKAVGSYVELLNFKITKHSEKFTKTLVGDVKRINESTGMGDEIEFQKSGYNLIASGDKFIGGDSSSIAEGITNDLCQTFTLNSSATLNYTTPGLDISGFNFGFPIKDTDIFNHIVELDGNITDITFKYKSSDTDFLEVTYSGLTAGFQNLSTPLSGLTTTGNPDLEKIISIDIIATVSASSTFRIEMLEILSGNPCEEIYTQTGNIVFFENDIENYLSFLGNGSLKTNILDFLINDGEFTAKIKGNGSFILRDDGNGDGYTLRKNGNIIDFGKIVGGVFSPIGDQGILTQATNALFLKVICKGGLFKYYYSDDGLAYNLIGEINDNTFTSGIISIIGQEGFRLYNISFVNEQTPTSISTILTYQGGQVVGSITRP